MSNNLIMKRKYLCKCPNSSISNKTFDRIQIKTLKSHYKFGPFMRIIDAVASSEGLVAGGVPTTPPPAGSLDMKGTRE